jgi:hypothetical protein
MSGNQETKALTEEDRLTLQDYLNKLEDWVKYGGDGKPEKPRFHWNPARFEREHRIRAAVEMVRRGEWEKVQGRAMSMAEFAELTGKTPAEVVQVNRDLFAYGRAKALAAFQSGRRRR